MICPKTLKDVIFGRLFSRACNFLHELQTYPYLTHDGYKADVPGVKKFFPATLNVDGVAVKTTISGGACRLDRATDELAITEGVETALGVRLMTGMPTWAGLSSGGIEKLEVPETVRLVVIAADHDAHGKGERAAHALAQRLLTEDRMRTVKILTPSTPDRDWADSLAEASSWTRD